jgi:hypothetical protein
MNYNIVDSLFARVYGSGHYERTMSQFLYEDLRALEAAGGQSERLEPAHARR